MKDKKCYSSISRKKYICKNILATTNGPYCIKHNKHLEIKGKYPDMLEECDKPEVI